MLRKWRSFPSDEYLIVIAMFVAMIVIGSKKESMLQPRPAGALLKLKHVNLRMGASTAHPHKKTASQNLVAQTSNVYHKFEQKSRTRDF